MVIILRNNTVKYSFVVILIFIFLTLFAYCAYGVYEKLSYPLKYRDETAAAAAAFSVEENVIFAVIKTESGFRADAVSVKGAVGLMQIMPSTGAYLYKKLYSKDMEEGALFEPKLNIFLGAYYIGYLKNRFDGDILWAAAAYNAGEANVSAWIKNGLSLNSIPYKETRAYVIKFEKALKKYNKLNPPKTKVTSID
ncbi:MAG: lytic transglycosylase domain-containing protein [Clostridiales bacterium]|jgi:soluble lytic murein transglycosylase|nr:lytic transglycosylase domain-containing protein [Clostridiales bacterium]